jgi:hypothetical protein
MIWTSFEEPVMNRMSAETAALSDLVADMERRIPVHLLPHVSKAEQVALVMQTTVDALAQDRYRARGLPYVKIGGRVRYIREDVLKYLADNRIGGAA